MKTLAATQEYRSYPRIDSRQHSVNVLHIIHSLSWGGAENQVVTLAPALCNSRYTIHVCCLRREGVQASKLRSRGVQVVALNMRLRYWPIAVYRLIRLIRKLKPKIVHTHMSDVCVWGAVVGRLAGVPVIVTTEVGMSPWKRRHHMLLDRVANHFNDKMIAVSEQICQHQIRNQVVSPDKVVVIPNAVDIQRFDGQKSQGQLKLQLGVDHSSWLVGTVARLAQPKRLDHLLKAARLVCDIAPKAQFIIVGDGPLRDQLERQAIQLDLAPDHLRFLGNLQHITDFLMALDIFALSSETEGIPVAMLEAMAASRPVVATQVGGIPQVIKDRHNGLLVPPHDPNGLAQAILTLMEDSALRRSVALEGYRTVSARFSTDAVCQQIVALYDDLLEKKDTRRVG